MVNRILQLGLSRRRKTDAGDVISKLGKLLDRFLILFSEIATEDENLHTTDFRDQLAQIRAQLSQATDVDALHAAIEAALQVCQDFFRRSRDYFFEREEEIGQVVDVLRKAVTDLSGNSSTVNDHLMKSSARFSQLVRIEDIRELRKQLVHEVSTLERVVQEKQKQEQETLSQISGRIEFLQAKLTQARQEASLDPLLKVANRGTFERTIGDWLHDQEHSKFVLAMLDVDNFKVINDSHGHPIGDKVLLCISKWLSKNIRLGDFLARFGGDEFAVLMNDLTLADAEQRFGSLIHRIAENPFEYGEGELRTVHMAVSCGLTAFARGDTAETLVQRADRALYEAKKQGKSRLVAAKS
jgi:diguanylate cyclase